MLNGCVPRGLFEMQRASHCFPAGTLLGLLELAPQRAVAFLWDAETFGGDVRAFGGPGLTHAHAAPKPPRLQVTYLLLGFLICLLM